MTSLCRHLSAQRIVNWVTTADGCVHTDHTTKLSPTSCEFVYTPPTRRDSTVSSRRRRRCVLGFKVDRESVLALKWSGTVFQVDGLAWLHILLYNMRLDLCLTATATANIYIIFSDSVWPLIKYNMQPSDWPVYRDLVMTSPYDDVIIHKLQYATTWLIEHIGGEGRGRGRQAVTERCEKKKNKNKNKEK